MTSIIIYVNAFPLHRALELQHTNIYKHAQTRLCTGRNDMKLIRLSTPLCDRKQVQNTGVLLYAKQGC